MEPWRILVVDDIADIADQTAEVIRTDPSRSADISVVVEVETSFDAALDLIDSSRIDLLVLDIRDQAVAAESGDAVDADEDGSDVTDADAGLAVFQKVRDRRFVPVVFHTGLTNLVDPRLIRAPFVQLVSKTDSDSTAQLRAAVNGVLTSTLPAVHRALNTHVEAVVREFMSGFVEVYWDELESPGRKGDLAHLLLRRLALSLADGGEVLSSLLADRTVVDLSEDNVHPMRFYVMPPIGDFTTGDLVVASLSDQSTGNSVRDASDAADDDIRRPETAIQPEEAAAPSDRWFVVLTPACDLVPARIKADFVVLAECVALETSPEYQEWARTRPAPGQDPTREANSAEKVLARLMRNNRQSRPADRDYFLPAAWTVPNLIVDFQRISSVKVEELTSKYRRVATIDSPYVDALVETFSRYLGRRGTPDLDTSLAIRQLGPLPPSASQSGDTGQDQR